MTDQDSFSSGPDRRYLPSTELSPIDSPIAPMQPPRSLNWASRLIILAGVILAGGFVVGLYSSFTISPLIDHLERQGYRVGKVQGSLKSGFNVESLSGDFGGIPFVAHNIQFQAHGFFDLYAQRRLIMEDVEIGSLTIQPEVAWLGRVSSVADQLPGTAANRRKEAADGPTAIQFLAAKSIKVANLEVAPKNSNKVFRFDNITAQTVSFNGTRLQIPTVFIMSSVLQMAWRDLIYLPQDRSGSVAASGTLKKSAHPSLQSDITFTSDFTLIDGKISRSAHEFFAGAVAVLQQGENYVFKFREFKPRAFWKDQLPFNLVHAEAELSVNVLRESFLGKGKVQLRNRDFVFTEPQEKSNLRDSALTAYYQNGSRQFRLSLISSKFEDWLKGGPLLRINSNQPMATEEMLAELYYNRSLAKLSPQERQLVSHDLVYIENQFPVAPQATNAADKKASRDTASVQPKANRPGKLPKKLPRKITKSR